MKRFLNQQGVLWLAILFIGYHIIGSAVGVASFVQLFLASSQDMPQVESTTSSDFEASETKVDRLVDILYGVNDSPTAWPQQIIIPSLMLHLPIVGSLKGANSWEVSSTAVTYASNTAIPNGIAGNTVLFAYNYPGLFDKLHQLKIKESIRLVVGESYYDYTAVSINEVDSSGRSLDKQSNEPTLTLVTGEQWNTGQRYVVTASFDQMRSVADSE